MIVSLADGSKQRVAVPQNQRWRSSVGKILATLDWDSFVAVDASDSIVGGKVENPDAGQEEGEFIPSGAVGEVAALLELMLRAQDVALSRQQQGYENVLRNNQGLVEAISGRLNQMEKHAEKNWEKMADLHQRLNALLIEGGAGENGADELVGRVLTMVAANQAKPAK